MAFIKGTEIASIIVVLVLILCYFGFEKDWLVMADVIKAFLTLALSFVGAIFGFNLAKDKEDARRKTEEKEAVNYALFILCQQLRLAIRAKRSYDEYAPGLKRAVISPIQYMTDYNKNLIVDFERLCFVMSASPYLLVDISKSQNAYAVMIGFANLRADFFDRTDLKNRLLNVGAHSLDLSDQEILAHLNDFEKSTVKHAIETCYASANDAIDKLNDAIDKLTGEARGMFPRDEFIRKDDFLDSEKRLF